MKFHKKYWDEKGTMKLRTTKDLGVEESTGLVFKCVSIGWEEGNKRNPGNVYLQYLV